MLIEFKVKNFMSFKEEIIFSMERSTADKDTLSNNFIKIDKLNILKSSIILGPNASGKTNLLLALDFIQWLVRDSRKFERKQKIKYFPFKLNSEYRDEKPISFQIKFMSNKNIYDYVIELRKKKSKNSEYNFLINSEKLIKNNIEIYKRTNNKFRFNEDEVSENTKTISKILLENSLLLSSYASNKTPDLKEAYEWFDKILTINLDGVLTKSPTIKNYSDIPKFKNFLMDHLNNSDLGNISELQIKEKKVIMEFPKDLPEEVKERIIFDNKYHVETYHLDDKKKKIEFDFNIEESRGTQKFIYLIGHIYNLIKENKVLVIDELENSLHPEILKLIFQLVHKSDCDAQLISATHSYSLLQYVNVGGEEIFRRDQIWFTRKKKDMSTQLYSLINVGGIRKDLRIFKAYFDGRLEAFPNIKFE